MFLEKIEISNFRGIRELSLNLNSTTVLIGENNTGKTSILEAIKACLKPLHSRSEREFSDYDYHLPEKSSQPTDSKAIEITLHFFEREENEWPAETTQRLSKVVQLDGQRQCIILRVRSEYRHSGNNFATEWHFLNTDGNTLPGSDTSRARNEIRQLAPVFYLSALRDAAQEFRSNSRFWGSFVRSMDIGPELKQDLETALAELNLKVLDAYESLGQIKNELGKTGKMIPLDSNEPVDIDVIPSRTFDILSRTQVILTSVAGARLPIGRHGDGTQSLAVICLFNAFLQSKVEERYTKHTKPILALEEPEAHLHPSAIRSASDLLQNLNGQKILATHSGDLVASVPLLSLRRLSRKAGNIAVHQVDADALTGDERRKIDHHIRLTRGNLLFARCWLLLEGETEVVLFKECARILERDLGHRGIACVEYTTIGIELLVKFANQLGIEWMAVADGDSQGTKYIQSAEQQLEGRSADLHLCPLPHQDIETFLCMAGYGAVYESNISDQKKEKIGDEWGTLGYWKQVVNAQSKRPSKPAKALSIIEEIENTGKAGVPCFVSDVIEKALQLAGQSQ